MSVRPPASSSSSSSSAGVTTAIAVVGATGRMGRAVVRLAHQAGLRVVCGIARSQRGNDCGVIAGIGAIGAPIVETAAEALAFEPSVVIDFSTPALLTCIAQACTSSTIAPALVSGTTGLDDAALSALHAVSTRCAVLWEPNMSVGIHVLAALVEAAEAALGPSFDVEVVEAHHRAKVDAPSGTALRLAEIVKRSRRAHYAHGRQGRPGPRAADEIGMHAVRGGDVIGDHTVFFFGDGERVELTHRASSRDVFAHGALRAAQWLAHQAPGRYDLATMIRESGRGAPEKPPASSSIAHVATDRAPHPPPTPESAP